MTVALKDLEVGMTLWVTATHEPANYSNGDCLEVVSIHENSQILSGRLVNGDEYMLYFAEVSLDPAEAFEEAVVHPAHYGGDAPYEVIKVAEAWDFDKDAYLFNVLKYIARHETKGKPLEDLRKALWYLERKIIRLEEASA